MRKLLYPLIVFIILLTGCQSKATESIKIISVADVDNFIIKTLPSPPKMKTINKKNDIDQIINHINSMSKEEIKENDIKGWVFLIQTKGKYPHSISLNSSIITIDNTCYKVSDNEVLKFRDLYNSLSYSEENSLE